MGWTMEAKANEILSTHRITVKNVKRSSGVTDQFYSIQFTYPKGKKRQFTGKTEEDVRRKVYQFFDESIITFRELYERWQNDPELTESESKKAIAARYGFKRYVDWLGDKIAAEVTPEDIIEAGKKHIASGCKTGSANTQIRNIKYMYEYGIGRGLVAVNPAVGVKKFRVQETRYERDYLTDRQIYEFLTECRKREEYMFAVFLICGIDMERFVPLRWKDIDFDNHTIDINRRMESRKSFTIVELERTQKVRLEEPEMAFDYLKLELKKQAKALGIPPDVLMESNRFIITRPKTERNTSSQAFGLRLDDLLRRKMKADYKMGDIVFTSAVYAFKAECDMPSVASIIGYRKTMEMFRNPEKYDLYERKKSRNVNDYFDELYQSSREEISLSPQREETTSN